MVGSEWLSGTLCTVLCFHISFAQHDDELSWEALQLARAQRLCLQFLSVMASVPRLEWWYNSRRAAQYIYTSVIRIFSSVWSARIVFKSSARLVTNPLGSKVQFAFFHDFFYMHTCWFIIVIINCRGSDVCRDFELKAFRGWFRHFFMIHSNIAVSGLMNSVWHGCLSIIRVEAKNPARHAYLSVLRQNIINDKLIENKCFLWVNTEEVWQFK